MLPQDWPEPVSALTLREDQPKLPNNSTYLESLIVSSDDNGEITSTQDSILFICDTCEPAMTPDFRLLEDYILPRFTVFCSAILKPSLFPSRVSGQPRELLIYGRNNLLSNYKMRWYVLGADTCPLTELITESCPSCTDHGYHFRFFTIILRGCVREYVIYRATLGTLQTDRERQ